MSTWLAISYRMRLVPLICIVWAPHLGDKYQARLYVQDIKMCPSVKKLTSVWKSTRARPKRVHTRNNWQLTDRWFFGVIEKSQQTNRHLHEEHGNDAIKSAEAEIFIVQLKVISLPRRGDSFMSDRTRYISNNGTHSVMGGFKSHIISLSHRGDSALMNVKIRWESW